ncbi:MAG: hypothetical protein M1822_000615 [Bathelium mastoideum]|nr:MAG: hypothetical protein M1822_000615 [Bathelium mastoideum]
MDPIQARGETGEKAVDFESLNWQKAKSLFIEARGAKDDQGKLDQFLQGWTSVQDAKDMCIATKNQASKEYAPMLGSILNKIDMASKVGDLAMKSAPESVGLAWMGVKLCLHSIMDDFATCQLFGVACSDIIGILISCACYGRMFSVPKGPESFREIHSQIVDRIPEIYSNILEVSFSVKKYMSHNKLVRTGKNFFRSAKEKYKDKIQELHDNEAKLSAFAHTASEEMQDYYAKKLLANQTQTIESQEAIAQDMNDLKAQLSAYLQIRKNEVTVNAELLEAFKSMNRKTPLAAAKDQCQAYQRQLRMDAIQSDILQRKQKDRKPPETCTWIFQNVEYKKWRDSASNSMLWVSGPGGCGKSILVSVIIDALGKEVEEGQNLLHYFYCDAGDESSKKTEKISRHILAQLLEMVEQMDLVGKIDEANKITEKFLRRKVGTEEAGEAGIKESISFAQAYREIARILDRPKIYFIIDALDECIDLEKEGLVRSLKDIISAEIPAVDLKLLICSRPEPEIQKEMDNFPWVDVERNNGPDIERNVKAELSELSGWTEEERELACKEVTRKAGSYFRCVALLIQLLKQPWRRPLSNRLSELPEGLNNNYREILQKTDPAYFEMLRICMMWITLAEDEVKVGEIMDVYSRTFTELHNTSLIPENDGNHQIHQIRTAGSSFVRVIDGTKVIKLRHHTVKEFFLGNGKLQSGAMRRMDTRQNMAGVLASEVPFVISEQNGHIEISISILDHLLSDLFRHTYMSSFLPSENDPPTGGQNAANGELANGAADNRDLSDDAPAAGPTENQLDNQVTESEDKPSKISDMEIDESITESSQVSNKEPDAGTLKAEKSEQESENIPSKEKPEADEKHANETIESHDSDFEVDSDDLNYEDTFRGNFVSPDDNAQATRYEPRYLIYHLQKIEELWELLPHDSALWTVLEERLDTFFQINSEPFSTWVNYLISADSPFIPSERGTITPIHVASAFGLAGLLKRFLDRGDDVHKVTGASWTALHMAASYNAKDVSSSARKFKVLRILLAAGVSPNFLPGEGRQGFTPFQVLLLYNCTVDYVRLFIEHGADCNLLSLSRRAALHVAVLDCEDSASMELVLEHTRDVNVSDHWGQTPLHLIMYQNKVPPQCLSALIQKGANINAEDDHSKMPLAIAASCGQPETVEKLIEAGADIEDDDLDGMTALHVATLNGRSSNVKSLLDMKANAARADSKGRTALYHACANGDFPTCEILVNWCQSNDPTILKQASKKGKTPLRKAAAGGREDVIDLLLNATGDVGINEADIPLGHTPLHAAARRGRSGIVDKLIGHEANTAIEDKDGRTALQVAYTVWSEDETDGEFENVLVSLIQEEPEKASQDLALLHVAASKGSVDILAQLYDLKVDFNKQDEHGWTALEFARQYRQEAMIRFLEEKGASVGKEPSKWEITKSKYLNVSSDGLEISYIPEAEQDGACALTDHPVPAGIRQYYFEIELCSLKNEEEQPVVAIGLSRKRNAAKLFKWFPGWRTAGPLSWGYHADDGAVACSAHRDLEWPRDDEKKYRYGDIVGCGFDLDRRSVFFTRNGVRFMNTAFSNASGCLYPVVGLRKSVTLKTNFGASEFKWKPGVTRDFDAAVVSEESETNKGLNEDDGVAKVDNSDGRDVIDAATDKAG